MSRALVKPVTVNIRDGQSVTAITEASRICHVAVTSSEFTSYRLLKRIWPSSVTSVKTIMKLPFRVFALCHSLRRMATLPLSFYGGLKFMRLFLQAMHTSTAEKLLSDHTSVACMCAFAHLNFS